MCRIDLSRCCRLSVGIVMGLAVHAAAVADETGVVRISDGTAQAVVRGQSPGGVVPASWDCVPPDYCAPYGAPHGVSGPSHGLVLGTAPHGGGYGACPHGRPGHHCWQCRGGGYPGGHSRYRDSGNLLVDGLAACFDRCLGALHDRLNLDQAGGSGYGVPLVGHYTMAYPVNPDYFDGRDGQVYAAQGYGGPVSVPLAPVVRHTYNYGWGLPSSRLTPISHPIHPGAEVR